MRRSQALLLWTIPVTLLTGCAATAGPSVATQARLGNPLVAERYWDEMVDRMATLQIGSDPLLADAKKAKVVEDTKRDALQRSQQEREKVRLGISGDFIAVAELTEGRALLLDGTLFLGSTFTAYPGPTLRLYLTEATDPRDGVFPDPTSVDLGALQTPYGAQEYLLPEEHQDNDALRTVVLWDRRLGRMHAFAQLGK